MDKLLAKIGWAAEGFQPHARLLNLDRDDLQGSAAIKDEDELDEKTDIVDQGDGLDPDDLDDAPIRGRRTDKSAKAYDALKSERDRLKADIEKQGRLIEEVNARLLRTEQGQQTRESREDVNRLANEEQQLIQARAKRLVDKVQSIRADDPERGQKIYTAMEEHNEEIRREERQLLLSEIDRRSEEVVSQRFTNEQHRERAHDTALDALKRAGLTDEGDFEMLQALSVIKSRKDPGWDKRMPNDEQIPYLVNLLKERLMKSKRESQEFRDEKRRHRDDQDGVLGETAATKRRSVRDEDEGDDEGGPGSMLADLSRWKTWLRRDTNRMLGRENRR